MSYCIVYANGLVVDENNLILENEFTPELNYCESEEQEGEES
jgi:hypothetical protein